MIDILGTFGILNLTQSPDIEQNSDDSIPDFRISDQSFIKENCHNPRTNDDIDMKLAPATKLYKRHKKTSKIVENDVMSVNCDVMVMFLFYGQFGAIWKPDSGRTNLRF